MVLQSKAPSTVKMYTAAFNCWKLKVYVKQKSEVQVIPAKPFQQKKVSVRELVLAELEAIGLDKQKFAQLASRWCLHLLQFMVHWFKSLGRWRSENAKDGYMSKSAPLSVQRNLLYLCIILL